MSVHKIRLPDGMFKPAVNGIFEPVVDGMFKSADDGMFKPVVDGSVNRFPDSSQHCPEISPDVFPTFSKQFPNMFPDSPLHVLRFPPKFKTRNYTPAHGNKKHGNKK